jgi:hypothetical protein
MADTDLKDLEAGNIQYTDEVLSLLLGVECLVDTSDQPANILAYNGLGQGSHGVDDLQVSAARFVSENPAQTRIECHKNLITLCRDH